MKEIYETTVCETLVLENQGRNSDEMMNKQVGLNTLSREKFSDCSTGRENFYQMLFCIYCDYHVVFVLYFVCIMFIDLQILYHLCIPGMNPFGHGV